MPKRHRNKSKERRQKLLYGKTPIQEPNKKARINYHEVYEEYYIYETDRISYVYNADIKNNKKQIVSARYDLKVGNEWVTITRFDNCHGGKLHQHSLNELGKDYEITIPINIKKNPTLNYLIKWTTNHLDKNWLNYRRHFFNVNKQKVKNLIDKL